ncbi:alpha/beta hydrolase [Pontibacter sp. E15-1]|uniref:alpha/beta fold hydrolase n=1 Tax=Pontibacter sp. E15-1 TaxID=2919918 RepID=UPI001F4F5298|nr:alpha/beta hydrolase [Pontibacter sp. E15-1]MCJ8165671.1 alpha/beta hydrolase [Pontibacter sp. E15-1]
MTDDKAVKQWGDQGETLVFLHYFGGSAESWQWVAEELSQEYRCIALNFPGFGGNAPLPTPSIQGFATFVQEELDQLGVKSYTLIGHSMGGKIAMQVAANAAAGLVKRLILVAPSPPTTEPMLEKEKTRMLKHPDRGVAENTVDGATIKTLDKEKYNLAVETQLIIDPNTWKWWIQQGMDNSIANELKTLKIPLTVLASTDDPVMTPEVIQERVMAELEHAKLINTEGVGHLIPLEAPDWTAAQIRKILEGSKEN